MAKYTKEQIFDVIQWILIIFLLGACIYIGKKNSDLNHSIEYRMANTYTKIYDSQKIESLKNENKVLYDSIKHLKNVESVVEIKYKYVFKSDTVYVNDTTKNDTLYRYTSKSDTISYDLEVAAKEVKWHKLDFSLNDKLLIVTKEKDNKIETNIQTELGTIDSSVMWHKKNKTFKDRFVIGPTFGVGYGLNNKKPDLFLGVGLTIDLW